MKLTELLSSLPEAELHGSGDPVVRGLQYDSRAVQAGDLFFAWQGTHRDGHDYAVLAQERGAIGVVGSVPVDRLALKVPYVRVIDPRRALAFAADCFYRHPSRALATIGITGTNGKTTTAFITKHLLEATGQRVGLIGTIRYQVGDRVLLARRTTPEGSDLHALLSEMRDADCSAVVMEVSSHALDQGRVAGMVFNVGVFTNLTPDHLDYHGNMAAYFAAKQRLFTELLMTDGSPVAVINRDDAAGKELCELVPRHARIVTTSSRGERESTLRASAVVTHARGTTFTLHHEEREHLVTIPLLGLFNVDNVLAALGVLIGLGHPVENLLPHLASCPEVPGRLERIPTSLGFTVVVDYAHTPDAVEKVLQMLRGLSPTRLTVVVGCGGNRDRTKRPLMARAAARVADRAIFTADNPRNESLSTIFDEMRPGTTDAFASVAWVEDRAEAIRRALIEAQPGEIICIAGKGHERTQEVAGEFHPFSDTEVVRGMIAELERESRR